MEWRKGEKLYTGKAKSGYAVIGHDELVWFEYRNDLTAFNALKKGEFAGKGQINRDIASLAFRYLKKQGVTSHWQQDIGASDMLVQRVEIIPIEVVVRNVLAGSTAKKFAIAEGTKLNEPLVEFYYKNDGLGDPFVSDDQALMLQAVRVEEIPVLKKQALQINQALRQFFLEVGLTLVDFKVEFGRSAGGVLLADEISPDTCRLWDTTTGERLDKDRFRRDLGGVQEGYQDVCGRLQKHWGSKV